MNKTLLSLLALSLLTTAALTSALTQPVPTHLVATAHPLSSDADGWLGDPITGLLDVALCWDDAGGVNPEDGNHTITASAESPYWVNTSITPAALHLVPPPGPTEGPGCTQTGTFIVTITAPDGVLPDTPVLVNVTLSSGDDTQSPIGTFAPPAQAWAMFQLHTVPSSGQPPDDDDDEDHGDDGDGSPGNGDDGDGGNDGNGGDDGDDGDGSPGSGDDEQKGAAGPAVVGLIALLVGLVALRRRC